LIFTLSACNSTNILPTPRPPLPTYAPLRPTLRYWEMGVTLTYPLGWETFLGVGQLMIVPDALTTRQNPPTEPILSFQVATLDALRLDKTATLEQIARRVSNFTPDTKVSSSQLTKFAGLDSLQLVVSEEKIGLVQQVIAFRLPDGRIGWMVALAPADQWANFRATVEQIQDSAALIRPTDYKIGTGQNSVRFANDEVIFTFPNDWTASSLTEDLQSWRYQPRTDQAYHDQSGFANGVQLVASVFPRPKDQSLLDALSKTIAATIPANLTAITMGTTSFPAARYTRFDSIANQQTIFIAFALPSKPDSMVILRWTVVGSLTEVTKPLLDDILQKVAIRQSR
jgi:hypothetical protein